MSEWVKKIVGNRGALFFILGPCAIENEAHSLKTAEFLKTLSEKLKFKLIFKSSFDKANRTALQSYRSVGLDEGLRILEKVKTTFDLPVITDVHEVCQIEPVASVVDVLQIPAFLCRQTDLLIAAGKAGKPVNVKKGQFVTVEQMHHALEKVQSTGNDHVWLCERGISFGYNNLVVDYCNFPLMKACNVPVVFDVTHSVQRPGKMGNSTGGDRSLVPTLAAAAVVQGIAGMFLEVHEQPEKALSDGPNSVRLSDLEKLLRYLIDLDQWAKEQEIPVIS